MIVYNPQRLNYANACFITMLLHYYYVITSLPGKRQALLTVVRGECTDEDITPISFYPLLPSLD